MHAPSSKTHPASDLVMMLRFEQGFIVQYIIITTSQLQCWASSSSGHLPLCHPSKAVYLQYSGEQQVLFTLLVELSPCQEPCTIRRLSSELSLLYSCLRFTLLWCFHVLQFLSGKYSSNQRKPEKRHLSSQVIYAMVCISSLSYKCLSISMHYK